MPSNKVLKMMTSSKWVVFHSETQSGSQAVRVMLGIKYRRLRLFTYPGFDLIDGSLCVCHCGASLLACGRDFQLRC